MSLSFEVFRLPTLCDIFPFQHTTWQLTTSLSVFMSELHQNKYEHTLCTPCVARVIPSAFGCAYAGTLLLQYKLTYPSISIESFHVLIVEEKAETFLKKTSVSPQFLLPQKSQGYTPFESILESSLHRTSSCGRILGPFDDHWRLGWFDRNPTTWDGCTVGSSRRRQNSGCCTGKTTFNHWKHGKIWSTEATRRLDSGWCGCEVFFSKVCFLCFFLVGGKVGVEFLLILEHLEN